MDCKKFREMLSKLTICLIALVFIFSTFVSKFLDNLKTDFDFNSFESQDSLQREKRFSELKSNDKITIDDQLKHTFWFMQITDLHISIHFDPKRTPDLEHFCTEYLDVIKPSVVLATGDLTDSRTRDPMGSTVFEREWLLYWNALNKTNVSSRTNWLDIKGNHDNFNVFEWKSDNNYFKKYSIRGPTNTRSYKFRLTHESETYSFIGVDACLDPSPKRPFNFIGLLHQNDINRIKQLKQSEIDSNYTIWFGHYPTSSIAMPSPGLRELINGPYFCGHYHTVGGLINHMYSSQPTGYLEVELSDWKDLRTIRLAAIDHNLFTFIDFKLNEWPIILITNPKNSLYSMPKLEPLHRIANSTHIRVLVFSNVNISSVEFRINNKQWTEMKHISGPLYVHKWNPNDYNSGLHWIEVTANDIHHNKRTVKHQFSLDGSKPNFPFGARFILRTHNRSIGYFLFAFSVCLSVLPILILKLIKINKKGKCIEELAETNTSRRILFKFYLLSNINKIMIPLIAIPLYATIGPWFVGYVLDEHIGVCFVWGMIIGGSYLPGGITYIMGSILLLFFHLPMTCCLSHIIYCRHKQLITTNEPNSGFLKTYCHLRHIFWLFFTICHILYSTAYYFAYGVMAYIFGFFNTWSYIIYIILWQLSVKLNPNSFPDTIRPKYKRQKDVENSNQIDLKRRPIRK